MRLIDVEEAKRFLEENLILPEISYEKIAITMLNAVPTAYDVDKVVEQLEELRGNELDGIRKGVSDIDLRQSIRGQNILNNAIEIVKSGGINKTKEAAE